MADRSTSGAGIALALALCWLVHAVAVFVPGSWLWGVDASRYLPAWIWLLWAAAVLLVPPVGTRASSGLEALGRALDRPLVALGVAAAAALVVLWLTDQSQFVGDFLLRQGTSEESLPAASLFPQALPLDVLLHLTFPTAAPSLLGWSANFAARVLDALEAGGLALVAIAFARRAGLRGAGLVAGAVLVWWGGWLALFTGYSKAFTELSLVMLAAGFLGIDALRGDRKSFAWLCVVVAIGLFVHRLALAFLPGLGFVAWSSARSPSLRPSKRSRAARGAVPAWLPLLLPAVALAVTLPQVLTSVGKLDAPHFAAQGEGAGSVLVHLFAPLRLLDLANLLFFLVPLAALAFVPLPGTVANRRAWWYLLVLGAPSWAVSLVIRPAHGMARGFDVFAPAGLALAMIAVMRLGGAWSAAPRLGRWAAAVTASAVVPIFAYLLLQSDLDRSIPRVIALADGPPRRDVGEEARLREYLGARLYRAQRFRESTDQFARSAALIPTPNILALWSVAARRSGDLASEERALTVLLERTPMERTAARAVALSGLARVALERGDRPQASRLVARALEADPTSAEAQALAARLAGTAP